MRCGDIGPLLSAYVDGQTSATERRIVEEHVARCGRCQAGLRRQQQTRRLLNSLNERPWSPPDLRLRVRQRLQREGRARPRHRRLVGIATGVAALLAVAVAGTQVLSPHASEPTTTVGTAPVASVPSPGPRRARSAVIHRAHIAPTVAQVTCRALPTARLAACLGVAQPMLPIVLAEARAAGAGMGQYRIVCGTRPSAPAACTVRLKGGEAHTISTWNALGLQPI